MVDAECRYSRTGEGLHRFVDPEDGAVYLYSHFEPAEAKRMFACFDQPDLKATFAVHVTAPFDWQVVSNTGGRTIEAGDAGSQLVHFEPTKRISTYLVALVAGPYAKVTDSHEGLPLGIYCRASLAQHLDADAIFAVTKQGFDFYHRVFDYPYPFDKYDQLFVPEFNAGAMENAGCVTFLEDYVFRSRTSRARYERRAETILHELAHMWFGDLVTMRWWDDLWLNESFATYISTLCQAEATEYTTAWTTFANTEKSWAYAQDQLPSTHPIAADMVDVAAVEVNFDGITYAKGASVLKQLVAYVGRTPSSPACAATSAPTSTATPRWPTCWARCPRPPGATCRPGRSSGCRPARSTRCARSSRSTTTAATAASPSSRPRCPSTRCCATTGWRGPLQRRPRRSDPHPPRRARRRRRPHRGRRAGRPPAADLVLVNDDDLTYAKIRLDERSLATLRLPHRRPRRVPAPGAVLVGRGT